MTEVIRREDPRAAHLAASTGRCCNRSGREARSSAVHTPLASQPQLGQGDLDTPMPSDADLDDADPCKSPSLTPSFSPEPDAISCGQAASRV